jgi:hypothetical protein
MWSNGLTLGQASDLGAVPFFGKTQLVLLLQQS